MIIVNTKNYKTGAELLKLAKLIEKYDTHMVLAVPTADISTVAQKTSLNVYAQHIDTIDSEKTTGFVSIASIKAHGATGTILNHAEHKLELSQLKKTIESCRKAKIVTIVCASSFEEVKRLAPLKPSAIALEDPKLIGTGKSIVNAKPKELAMFATYLRDKSIIPICGAGISSVKDIEAAYELGCKGVLIASAITDSKSNLKLIKNIAQLERKLLD